MELVDIGVGERILEPTLGEQQPHPSAVEEDHPLRAVGGEAGGVEQRTGLSHGAALDEDLGEEG